MSTPQYATYNGASGGGGGGSDANLRLSNLQAPTAVNQDLLPKTDDSLNLGNDSSNGVGSSTLRWSSLCVSEAIYINGTGGTGSQAGLVIQGGLSLSVQNGGGATIDGTLSVTSGGIQIQNDFGLTFTAGFGSTGSIGGQLGRNYANPSAVYNWGFYSALQISTPSFPSHDSSGNVTISYAKSDGNLYAFPEGGAENQLIGAVAGTPASGAGTLTNLPTGKSGNPTGYLLAKFGGTTIYIPYW